MPEGAQLETIDANEVAGIHGVEGESVSNRRRGDQQIHGACSLASSSPSECRDDVTVSARCQAVKRNHSQLDENRFEAFHA